MFRLFFRSFVLTLFILVLILKTGWAEVSAPTYVTLRPVSITSPQVNQPFQAVLTFHIPNHWHMEEPNESMPILKWNLPDGISIQSIQWPKLKPFDNLVTKQPSLGFVGDASALITFDVKKTSDKPISVYVTWSMCSDRCTLHKAQVNLDGPLSATEKKRIFSELAVDTPMFAWLLPYVLAFLGGLILNIMPCVLPVLSLKVLDFISMCPKQPWKHGVSFTGGVCAGFSLFAAIITALKTGGMQAFGWGFHMQSPAFVAVMMILFFFMALHMWGLFEVGISLTRLILPKRLQNPLCRSFGTGLLACWVATPCTAPFMGSALAYGLTASPWDLLMILISLGLGLSAPVLFLTAFPGWMRFLPKPGRWMIHLKKTLSLGFLATSCWLAYVLADLTWPEPIDTAEDRIQVQKWIQERKPVWLTFTAKWCVTCQINKRLMSDSDIEKAFEQSDVKRVVIDLTNDNPEGFRWLSSFDRVSIPLDVFICPKKNKPHILPPILTKKDVLNTLCG